MFTEVVLRCLLLGRTFVLKDACLDFAGVRCPEQRGGCFSEVIYTLNAG